MTDFEIVATGEFPVNWVDAPPLCESLKERAAQVDEEWANAVIASSGRLFNGEFLNLVGIDAADSPVRVKAHYDEYKYFYVSRLHPEWNLPVRGIGVSGITIVHQADEEWLVFARRAKELTQYPTYWELVPSGTIDKSCARADGTLDYRRKLLEEFEEETTRPPASVRSIEAFAIIRDVLDGSYDLCCRIDLDDHVDEIIAGLNNAEEYYEPRLVKCRDVTTFVADVGEMLVPTSRGLLSVYLEQFKAQPGASQPL